MTVTHCLGKECLTWEREGACQCECRACCLARITWDPVSGVHTCEGGQMEEVLHRVRATRIEPGDLLVITLPGKVEPEAASALGKSLRAELNLAENRVLILQNGAQATTVSETLQTLHDLLDDAARSITALAGVVQHCQRHPDAVVAARDDRIVGYAVQTALMANDYVAHGTLPNREEASNDEEANAESG